MVLTKIEREVCFENGFLALGKYRIWALRGLSFGIPVLPYLYLSDIFLTNHSI